MNTKNLVIGVLVVLALVFGVLYYQAQSQLGGAGSGPNHFQTENFLQGLFGGTAGQFGVRNNGTTFNAGGVEGGTVLNIATTTVTILGLSSQLLTGSQMCTVNMIM